MLSVVGLNHPEARLLTLRAQEGAHGLDVATELAAANGVAGLWDVRLGPWAQAPEAQPHPPQ